MSLEEKLKKMFIVELLNVSIIAKDFNLLIIKMKTKEELILENLICRVEKEDGETMFLLGLKVALIEINNKR